LKVGSYKFDRMEFAGSLGDFGTLIPLSVALIMINGLSFSSVFVLVGIFYITTGLYYRLPIPVQPLKVVSAIAIACPDKITLSVMSATAFLFGVILLLLAFTGLIDKLAKLFTKPIVRGIQLGLGFILMLKGIDLIRKPELLMNGIGSDVTFFGILPLNIGVGIGAVFLVLFLLKNRKFPAALVVIFAGILVGIPFGSFSGIEWGFGPTQMEYFVPSFNDLLTALVLLVIPQIPLTLGNAIIGTSDTAKTLFGSGEETKRVTNRSLSLSMGLANLFVGIFGAMPMCHGAGGLAAHYRFGARTGGSNIMIGLLFVLIALGFGVVGISLLTSIPNAVLGTLLLFAGLELALLVRDLTEKQDLFIVFLIAGIGLATSNMSIAFGVGIIVSWLMKFNKVKI
jgi:sulfate permease, SulP family